MPAPKPTDFYDDENRQQLFALDHLVSLPEFVKNAELETKEALAALPTTSFADPKNRKFPCHTKAASYLANAYFQAAKPLYPKEEAGSIQARLEKFASFWQIKHLCGLFNKTWAKVASAELPDLGDNDYALIYEADGHKIRHMPMPNAISVKRAGEYLYANRFMYTYPMRKMAAQRILLKAAAYDEKARKGEKVAGAAFGSLRFEHDTLAYLERAAGLGATHPMWAAEKIAQRVILLGNNNRNMGIKVKLAEVAEQLKSLHEIGTPELYKLAELVDAVDRESGLANHYNEGVDLPEEMFFAVLEKEAEEVLDNYITLQTGNSYPVETLLRLPLEKVAKVLGDDFVNAIRRDDMLGLDAYKFAELIPTLPRDDAELLERAIAEAQREPLAKSAWRDADYTKEGFADYLRKRGHRVVTHESGETIHLNTQG